MDIMEEGNLMDRVRILLQRDQAYYNKYQKILLENVCPTVIGGFLDFPCVTTFVANKIVTWWEENYFLLFHSLSSLFQGSIEVDFSKEEQHISVGKSITPKEFVALIAQSSMKLLDHLHILSQEALDHADLSVLTGTIGTVTLVRNTIWIYNQQLIKTKLGVSLSQELKTFQNMSEALAERLLDLHCRLISLYILQDVDCLNWSAEHPFFEGERSSYTIQMWWLYVQGTREDLWNSMPPKIAENIFSGLLSESLTILTSRYMQAKPNKARSELIVADLSNLLLCMFKLLPAICENADEFLGCKVISNVVRDIHVKCHLLFCNFLLRGTPLSILYRNFKDGFTNATCLMKNLSNTIEPWIIFTASQSNETFPIGLKNCISLPSQLAIKYELLVLLSKAQPTWPLLLKIARTNDCYILHDILHHIIIEENETEYETNVEFCKGFLCNDDCVVFGDIQSSITYLLLFIGNKNDIQNTIIKVLEQVPEKWAIYFNYSQIWNQNRPLWIKTILSVIQPTIKYITKIISTNSQNNTSAEKLDMYFEYMKSVVSCLHDGIVLLSSLIENILPPDVIPLGNSVLIQLMTMSLYDELGSESLIAEILCRYKSHKLYEFRKNIEDHTQNLPHNLSYLQNTETNEILINQILTDKSGRSSLKVLYEYIKFKADWLQIKLGIKLKNNKNNGLLYKMFYIGDSPYDQVLSGTWVPKWILFLNMPLALTFERIQNQLSMRTEFIEDKKLTKHDLAIVNQLKSQFVPLINCTI